MSIRKGTELFRIHDSSLSALWFGDLKAPARKRFDDPERRFGVCYFAFTRDGAFAETFLRTLPARFISRADTDRRSMTTVRLARKLRACLLHGKGLPRLGATAAISAGSQSAARNWSRTIWERSSQVDAIQHRTRHDNDELALAVFDRASSALQVVDSVAIRADRAWFASVLERYRLGLVD